MYTTAPQKELVSRSQDPEVSPGRGADMEANGLSGPGRGHDFGKVRLRAAPAIQRAALDGPEEAPLESDDDLLLCLAWNFLEPELPYPCFEMDDKKVFKGGGGRSGGGGSSGSWSPAPAPGVQPPSGPPPSVPDKPAAASQKLNFYHGTRWSTAKIIPGNVQPLGGGDFAAGFYTHHDENDSKAEARAIKWGRVIANQRPAEPYAGVIRFEVVETDYKQLFAGGKGKSFNLTNTDQKDFKARQKEWLDFITSTGRMKDPAFNAKRKQWIHNRADPQPHLNYNIIDGPFYTPLSGSKDKKPPPEDFKPYAEGKVLPQQVVWANDGIKLLNSAKVKTELKQYDAKTGKPQDPPINAAAAAGGASKASGAQDAAAAEEAQFSM